MPRVVRTADGFWDTVEWFRQLYTMLPSRLELALIEHRLIFDAIKNRRAEDASQFLHLHIRRTRIALVEHGSRLTELSQAYLGPAIDLEPQPDATLDG